MRETRYYCDLCRKDITDEVLPARSKFPDIDTAVYKNTVFQVSSGAPLQFVSHSSGIVCEICESCHDTLQNFITRVLDGVGYIKGT